MSRLLRKGAGLAALVLTTSLARQAAAQQLTRVYSQEQSTLVSSSAGVATSYYLPTGQAVTAYGVPASTFYPPAPPTRYTTFYAPGARLYLAPPVYGQPFNRLSGYSYWPAQ